MRFQEIKKWIIAELVVDTSLRRIQSQGKFFVTLTERHRLVILAYGSQVCSGHWHETMHCA